MSSSTAATPLRCCSSSALLGSCGARISYTCVRASTHVSMWVCGCVSVSVRVCVCVCVRVDIGLGACANRARIRVSASEFYGQASKSVSVLCACMRAYVGLYARMHACVSRAVCLRHFRLPISGPWLGPRYPPPPPPAPPPPPPPSPAPPPQFLAQFHASHLTYSTGTRRGPSQRPPGCPARSLSYAHSVWQNKWPIFRASLLSGSVRRALEFSHIAAVLETVRCYTTADLARVHCYCRSDARPPARAAPVAAAALLCSLLPPLRAHFRSLHHPPSFLPWDASPTNRYMLQRITPSLPIILRRARNRILLTPSRRDGWDLPVSIRSAPRAAIFRCS